MPHNCKLLCDDGSVRILPTSPIDNEFMIKKSRGGYVTVSDEVCLDMPRKATNPTKWSLFAEA